MVGIFHGYVSHNQMVDFWDGTWAFQQGFGDFLPGPGLGETPVRSGLLRAPPMG